MSATVDLARAAEQAFTWASAQQDVVEVEVFAAANTSLVARLNYTSHLPANGVEEPKSVESGGLGVQAVFARDGGALIGFGSEPGEITADTVARALATARRAAVADPDFVSLPAPGSDQRTLGRYHDPSVATMDDRGLVEAGWKVLGGALRAFQTSSRLAALAGTERRLPELGLIVGGDVTALHERIAIVSSRMPSVQTDESTLVMATITAMVESHQAKGSGWWTGTRLEELTDEAGAEAAQHAIDAIDGVRVPAGQYRVVFGPQPVAELLSNLVVPACTASAFYTSSTPFLGKLGAQIAVPGLTIHDDGAAPGRMGSKGVTCEGLPTGRTDLIRDGVLTGCLTSWYEAQRLRRDPALGEKLGGTGADADRALVPRNGFRFGGAGGRQFDGVPGIAASNVIVEGADARSLPALFERIGDGLFIGRIWYCYAINGLAAGDFTCTVVGDSYIIRDGRLARPLRANVVRIDDNIVRVLAHVIGVGKETRGTVLWAADEVVYAPAIAVEGVPVNEIGEWSDTREVD